MWGGHLVDTTSVSLLRRLREPQDDAAWQRLVELYAPLVFHWGRTQGFSSADASDLVQEVFLILMRKLPEFDYDPAQRFRGWLRTITLNKARDLQRAHARRASNGRAEGVERVAVESCADLFEETEYRGFLVKRALRLMRTEFQPQTWQACWMHVAEGRPAAEVAQELGITPNAVYIAKSRVLRRLREELDALVL